MICVGKTARVAERWINFRLMNLKAFDASRRYFREIDKLHLKPETGRTLAEIGIEITENLRKIEGLMRSKKINPLVRVRSSEKTADICLRRAKREVRLGVIGGTFDPIHYGHICLALEAIIECRLDTVIFTPGGDMPNYPDYKPGKQASELRHLIAREALKPFYPILRYSPLGMEHHDIGNSDLSLEILRLNPKPGIKLFYLCGGDTVAGNMKCIGRRVKELGIENTEITFVVRNRMKFPVPPFDKRMMPSWDVVWIKRDEPWGLSSSQTCLDISENIIFVPFGAQAAIEKAGSYKGGTRKE